MAGHGGAGRAVRRRKPGARPCRRKKHPGSGEYAIDYTEPGVLLSTRVMHPPTPLAVREASSQRTPRSRRFYDTLEVYLISDGDLKAR